jgi:hypothetical protein
MVRSLLISFMAAGLLVLLVTGVGVRAGDPEPKGVGISGDLRPTLSGPAMRPPEMAPPRPFVYPPSTVPARRDKDFPKMRRRSDLGAFFALR